MRRKRKKKILIYLFCVTFIVLFYSMCFWYYIEKNVFIIKCNNGFTVEINSKVSYSDFVKKIRNGYIINGDEVVDTSELGNQKLKLIVKNNKNEENEFEILIKVVDTIKPVIKCQKEIKIYVGRDIDLLDYVKVSDNSNEDIKVEIIGKYDLNSEGMYNLKYTAVDSSLNKSEYDFVLNVVSDENNRVFMTRNGFLGKVIDGVTYIDGVLIVNKTYALPDTYGNGITSDAQKAFDKMKNDASKLGLNLWIGSGYRSYSLQEIVYTSYVDSNGRAKADTYSARAGHSEHQAGLAFDLNTISSDFAYTNEGKWVYDNCYKYGLILRYPKDKVSVTGYKYEPWHLRYVGVELATKLYNNGNWITLEEYYGIDSKYE